MEIRFDNRAGRWLFLFAILLASATLAFLGGKNALADFYGESSRAARLEPGNADAWYRLARYRELDFEHADLPLAISLYRRALDVDPRSAFYWTDLANAYETAGDPANAREAFLMAKSVHPVSAQVAWRYGNFLLRQEQLAEAFAEIRRAVTTDPKLAALAISRCWRSSRDTERVLGQAMPATIHAYQASLDFFVADHEPDAALLVWKRRGRVEEARVVWGQALGIAGLPGQGYSSQPSLVWDGGFESELTNGGFGWRYQDLPGATVEFDTETRHSGARSLRVTFDGSANLDFRHLMQLVPVEPNTRYRFTAFLRTKELSTNSGIHFMVYPRNPQSVALFTPNLVGTQPWTLAETEFITSPETHLVEVVLRRIPSQKLDNKIQGTVWVDDVSLRAVSPQAERPSS
ncbi:MAG: hypothetical protein DMG29_10385 [Acidobacteria bacterium]|nr:MAG: hypothetical protein DMG29_10385 [Acidobacteriota bacterium]